MDTNDFVVTSLRLCHNGAVRGWDRDTKRLWPTLTRQGLDEAWGFSLNCGFDVGENSAHWSGIVAHRHDKGMVIKVCSVRAGSPAALADIRPRDLITRINGQIVFHLKPKDVERIVNNSGCHLLLDIERDGARSMLYDGGVHGTALNFLFGEHKEECPAPFHAHQYCHRADIAGSGARRAGHPRDRHYRDIYKWMY